MEVEGAKIISGNLDSSWHRNDVISLSPGKGSVLNAPLFLRFLYRYQLCREPEKHSLEQLESSFCLKICVSLGIYVHVTDVNQDFLMQKAVCRDLWRFPVCVYLSCVSVLRYPGIILPFLTEFLHNDQGFCQHLLSIFFPSVYQS